jgi:hypothetical protein
MKYQTALAQDTTPSIGTFISRVILSVTMMGSELPVLRFEEIY